MKKITTLLIILTSFFNYSQENSNNNFGNISEKEFNLTSYEKDSTANALVLDEFGNTIFKYDDHSENIIMKTKVYKKIKLFNSEGFKYATFKIDLYKNENKKEKITGLKGITHNGLNKTFLSPKNIYENEITENWNQLSFTMPNLKEGSIIEIEYTLESPFKYNLTGWTFQSEIPKLKSMYNAQIPGNYIYNRTLVGYLKLRTNSSTIKKNCFKLPGIAKEADCEEVTYSMENIPAIEDEDYITNIDNYISKIKFELSEFQYFDGGRKKFTKTWDDIDREFKTNENFGRQLKKVNLLEDLIPTEIATIQPELERAKAIYTFIQNYFTWNNKYQIFKDTNIKEAIKTKIGDIGDINISLINALNSAGLDANLVLLSTRDNGLATKIHPVISEFNYVIASLKLNDKTYLLDASDKLIPFGILPLRCLNSYARVMDYKNGSYWIDIEPNKDSRTTLTASLNLNTNNEITGKVRKIYQGYHAVNRRKDIINKSDDEIISEFENEFTNIEIVNYQVENKYDINNSLIEVFEIVTENLDANNTLFFNPFFDEKITKNPFTKSERLYPIDFGYTRKLVVNVILNIPENYSITSFPKPTAYSLENNSGKFTLNIKKNSETNLMLNSVMEINKPFFHNFEYYTLKELYKLIINSQQTPIELTKK